MSVSASVFAQERPRFGMISLFKSLTTRNGAQCECIVIQLRDGEVFWTASTWNSAKPSSGALKVPGEYSRNAVSELMSKMTDTDERERPKRTWTSLVSVSQGGEVSIVRDLSIEEVSHLRRCLRLVFDDILENGPYAKSNPMRAIIEEEDALRDETLQPQ